MEVRSKNQQIYEQLKQCVVADFYFPSNFSDFDEVGYRLQRTDSAIVMSFRCHNYSGIFKISGEATLKKYFSDLKVEPPEDKFDLTLSVAKDRFPIFQEDTSKMPRDQVRALKKASVEIMKGIAERLASLKQLFFGGPLRLVMETYRQGKSRCLSYLVTPHFKVWVIGLPDKVLVYFGLGFSDPTEHQLAKLILQEMEEARRQVNNSPQIHMMHNQKVPETLLEKFRDVKEELSSLELNNGILEVTLFPQHLKEQQEEQLLDYLQSFKTYLHYHMSAIKTYLHGRLRKKCNALIGQIKDSRIEDDLS